MDNHKVHRQSRSLSRNLAGGPVHSQKCRSGQRLATPRGVVHSKASIRLSTPALSGLRICGGFRQGRRADGDGFHGVARGLWVHGLSCGRCPWRRRHTCGGCAAVLHWDLTGVLPKGALSGVFHSGLSAFRVPNALPNGKGCHVKWGIRPVAIEWQLGSEFA